MAESASAVLGVVKVGLLPTARDNPDGLTTATAATAAAKGATQQAPNRQPWITWIESTPGQLVGLP
jgi:hypothetical protein